MTWLSQEHVIQNILNTGQHPSGKWAITQSRLAPPLDWRLWQLPGLSILSTGRNALCTQWSAARQRAFAGQRGWTSSQTRNRTKSGRRARTRIWPEISEKPSLEWCRQRCPPTSREESVTWPLPSSHHRSIKGSARCAGPCRTAPWACRLLSGCSSWPDPRAGEWRRMITTPTRYQ